MSYYASTDHVMVHTVSSREMNGKYGRFGRGLPRPLIHENGHAGRRDIRDKRVIISIRKHSHREGTG